MSSKIIKREHPILFSEQMVQALADGRKSVTRRTSGLKEINLKPNDYIFHQLVERNEVLYAQFWKKEAHQQTSVEVRCPFGIPGHTLWVRETYASGFSGHVSTCGYLYKATDVGKESHHGKWCYRSNNKYYDHYGKQFKWTPNIHMKRVAARFEYEVVSITMEPVQSITEADAVAEGVRFVHPVYYDNGSLVNIYDDNADVRLLPGVVLDARAEFAFLINSLHRHKTLERKVKDPWELNIWMWVVRFKKIEEIF